MRKVTIGSKKEPLKLGKNEKVRKDLLESNTYRTV